MEFRLLVESSDPVSQSSRSSLFLEGRHWKLSQLLDLQNDEHLPPFACISYLWGPDRETYDGREISTRTRPVLAAAIRTGNFKAFWLDCFCVPPDGGPERLSTLENMGYIYSRATEVIIVLSEGTFSVIQEMLHKGFVLEPGLQMLERDEWVSSIWTYQEIVNGGSIRFVSDREDDTSASLEGSAFFNALGYSLSKWRNSTGSNAFDLVEAFPHLNALDDIIVDCEIGAYTLRPALAIFSSIASKRNFNLANFFYAILGALTQSPEQLVWNDRQNLEEKVMAICECKNDFSFIYTVAARDSDTQKRWRPRAMPLSSPTPALPLRAPAILRPILAWHCWGEAQRGHYDDNGFWLHGMTSMQPASSIGNTGRKAISDWLRKPELQHMDDAALGSALHSTISSIGFEGEATPIIVAEGLLFAQDTLRREDVARVLVSNQIRWTMGAPGLVHVSKGNEKQYIPCAFIGSTDRLLGDGESILL